MGDPVTMAVVGASAGAMMNKKDPLKGAMLGAAGGYGAATLLPVMGGSTTASSTGILPSASSGSMTAATNPALVTASMPSAAPSVAFQTAAASPTSALGVEAMKTAGPGIFSKPTSVNTAMTPSIQRPLSLTMPGVEPGQGYEYTLGDRLNQVGQFAQQNPVLTQMAMRTGQDLLSQQPAQPTPAGLMRGSPSQVAAPQYQVGIPRVSLI